MPRPTVEWVDPSHVAILEFLENRPCRPLNSTPAVIEANIEFSESTVQKRIRELYLAGFVEYYDEDRAIYSLTDEGQRFLDGDMSASEATRRFADRVGADDDTEYIDNNFYAEESER
jgi:predicted transcriptional regulator